MQSIKELLPQREPFLFVEKILRCDKNLIISKQSFSDNFIFAQTMPLTGEKYVPTSILVESIVQSGGAGINKSGYGHSGIYALASIDKVKVRGIVRIPATLTMKIKTDKAGKVLRQSGSIYLDDKLILKASWCCVLMKNK